jgi:dipeptidase
MMCAKKMLWSLLFAPLGTLACTNLLCSKGASTDGSNIIAYNADASNFYTSIYHYPAGIHSNETSRKMWTWEYVTNEKHL